MLSIWPLGNKPPLHTELLPPRPGKFDPFFLKDTILFPHCRRLPMEGFSPSGLIMPWKADPACSHCQRESDPCAGSHPILHLTLCWHSIAHVGTRTRTPLLPSSPVIGWAVTERAPSPQETNWGGEILTLISRWSFKSSSWVSSGLWNKRGVLSWELSSWLFELS